MHDMLCILHLYSGLTSQNRWDSMRNCNLLLLLEGFSPTANMKNGDVVSASRCIFALT